MDFLQKYEEKKNQILLIEQKPSNTKEHMISIAGTDKICVCDFYVEGAESWENKDGALVSGATMNIDHHSPMESLRKHISSGNIASRYVKMNGILGDDYKVIINHTDCDSIISAFIMLGILGPEKRYEDAVIAADHTGKDDEIADLLQSIEHKRDIDFITKNIFQLLQRKGIDDEAQSLLKKRIYNRDMLRELIKDKRFKRSENVAYIVTDTNLDPTALVSLLPEYEVIFVASRSRKNMSKWIYRLRLGINVKNFSLKELELPDFGGRWNAGSTRRHGGTSIPPDEYARIIDKSINELYLVKKK